MTNIILSFLNVALLGAVVLWCVKKETALTARGRKKIRFIYLTPLIIYILLTTIFAPQIISLLGPCKVSVLSGPIRGKLFFWVYPEFNCFFFLVYFLNLSLTLTHWEAIVKTKDKIFFTFPFLTFISIIFLGLAVSGNITAWPEIKPLGCWVFFMAVAYTAATMIVLHDLNKQFQKSVQKKQERAEQGRGRHKKRLLLIYPVNDLHAGFATNIYFRMPPMPMAILAALTPEEEFEVALIDEQFEQFTYQEADLVAITAFSAHAPRAYKITAVYREKGIPVVMGGIHASMRTEEALRFVDSVVVGEAEPIWPTVLADYLSGSLQPVYRSDYPELANTVIPDRSIYNDKHIMHTIQSSRGCPRNCDFCSVTRFNGKRYRQRPVGEILDELETIPGRHVFFVDDNLIGYGKAAEERALALFKGIVRRKIVKSWIAQTTIDIGAKPELLKWAAKSGCIVLFIGLEFIDAENLKNSNKHFALKIDYKKALKNINRAGIGVLGAFIYGSDLDTKEKMMQRARFIARNRVDIMQQTILTPIPGSRTFNAMASENRIVCANYPEDWETYNGFTLTHIPRNMSQEEFLKTYRWCIEKTYAFPTLWWKALKTLFYTRRVEVAVGSMRLNFSYRAFTLKNIEKQEIALSQQETRIERLTA